MAPVVELHQAVALIGRFPALAGADLSETRLEGAWGAAIAVFHARNAMHWSTGKALEAIAHGDSHSSRVRV